MATIPKKVVERYMKTVSKFQRALKIARDRDINEADTVAITQDILAEVFGFKKYLEITSEFAIRGGYCDLAIKVDEKIQYLIEVKAIGHTLKDHDLQQVVNYGANHGAEWVVLTNGITWELHKIRFEKPINHELVSSFNFLELNPRKKEDQEKLFLLSKKGLSSAREDYYARVQSINCFVIQAIILSESIMSAIRKDIRRLSPGLKIEIAEIEKILRNEVLKRNVMDGDKASDAIRRVRRLYHKPTKRPRISRRKEVASSENSKTSLSDQLLKEEE